MQGERIGKRGQGGGSAWKRDWAIDRRNGYPTLNEGKMLKCQLRPYVSNLTCQGITDKTNADGVICQDSEGAWPFSCLMTKAFWRKVPAGDSARSRPLRGAVCRLADWKLENAMPAADFFFTGQKLFWNHCSITCLIPGFHDYFSEKFLFFWK